MKLDGHDNNKLSAYRYELTYVLVKVTTSSIVLPTKELDRVGATCKSCGNGTQSLDCQIHMASLCWCWARVSQARDGNGCVC
jgi:hypothetical protein